MKTRELTHARLLESINYDPETGIFTRHPPNHKRKVGRHDKSGYLVIAIDRVKHQAHRLAWLYMTGVHPGEELHIDHINHVRNDNRWHNLREATPLENLLNRRYVEGGSGKRGRSGILGVYWDGRKNLWYVFMRRRGRNFYGGSHKTLEAARENANAMMERVREHFASDISL